MSKHKCVPAEHGSVGNFIPEHQGSVASAEDRDNSRRRSSSVSQYGASSLKEQPRQALEADRCSFGITVQKDIKPVDRMQRRAARMWQGLEGKP